MTSEISFSVTVGTKTTALPIFNGMSIGRASSNDLYLENNTVSGVHARVASVGSQWVLTDVGSNNGTLVDDREMLRKGQTTVLTPGKRLRFGEVEVIIVGKADQEPAGADSTIVDAADWRTTPRATQPDPQESMATIQDMAAPAPAAKPKPVAAPKPAVVEKAPAPAPVPVAKAAPPSQAPAPAPLAPEKAKPVTAPPVPASAHFDPNLDSSLGEMIPTISGMPDGGSDLAAISALIARGARLLILNDADRRSVALRKTVTMIGRSRKADCRIDNGGVSNEHLRLSFHLEGSGFLVEDLGSQNGSVLNRVPLRKGNPQPLDSDAHLRIGTVEAIVRCALDSQGVPVPANFDQRVATGLIKSGVLAKSALKAARRKQKESDQPLGDTLLLEGRITPEQWAVQSRRTLQAPAGSEGPRFGLILIVVILVVLVLSVVLVLTGNLTFSNSTLP